MRSLLRVLVALVLLSCVPAVRSGINDEVRVMYSSCWRQKGVCKTTCLSDELFHILCDDVDVCCVRKGFLPPLVEPENVDY
ncbi:beta-defensin 135 [Perognathus longimembris pacificus]|uniref:beta-defensin 135 n=1 Tax=Perognathus longimembris pacificus TaxID=214514 RepID=UPI002018C652|nr:beta-defensin 135 [Perognathus longimembris pacificus]